MDFINSTLLNQLLHFTTYDDKFNVDVIIHNEDKYEPILRKITRGYREN